MNMYEKNPFFTHPSKSLLINLCIQRPQGFRTSASGVKGEEPLTEPLHQWGFRHIKVHLDMNTNVKI